MAIDFTSALNKASGNKASATETEQRPASKVWINIGVETGDDQYSFLSLPMGIPLDNMEPVKVPSAKNEDFRNFRLAQNDLLSQIQALAATLKPGEERILNLAVQIRHIEDAAEQTGDMSDNKFAVKLDA